MSRCIQLAKNALGTAAPNPMVGAVIVHNNVIIGEGFTGAYGTAHAEVNAIKSVKNTSLLDTATLYVTLEPCSHFGKTPPCVDMVIQHRIPKVIIGIPDPNPKVAGNGISKLRASGCDVVTGILEAECIEHHKRFLTFYNKKRPFIILKWAETLDGFLAPELTERTTTPQPYWITNSYAQRLVHKWRSEEQAILVGTTTVLQDNPKLTTRSWAGNTPTRLILDRYLKIKKTHHVLNDDANTLIITEKDPLLTSKENISYVIINYTNSLAQQICDLIYTQGITSVLIEGGAQTIQTFIDANLWDEARVFVGSVSFQKGVKAPNLPKSYSHSATYDGDLLNLYRND